MPGPGSRKSKKNTKSRPVRDLSNVDIPTVVDSFVDQINDTRGWNTVVRLLCGMFDLPDLDTRSGLKRVHSNFEEIQRNLDAAYKKYSDNPKVAAGIVGIWSKMSNDSILRNKIIDAGLMPKLMPLLDNPQTRLVGLQALSNVTHHGGAKFRRHIATYTPDLLRLMEEFPDDPAINEQIIVTLAHAIGSVVNDEDSSPSVKKTNIRNLDIARVFDAVFRSIKKPDASHNMLSHAIEFLCSVAIACHDEVMANSSVLNLLIALLRSSDISARVSSFGGLVELVKPDSELPNRNLDPMKYINAMRKRMPAHLNSILLAYGFERCDTFIYASTARDFQMAMQGVIQTHDLCALGLKLAEFIQRTEYSIADGAYQVENKKTGKLEFYNFGLPFTMWGDSLPHCAKALRARNGPGDLDAADIVECKFHVMKGRVPDAVKVAQQAIERSPQVAYYYYIVGLGADQAVGLRACKKGLKCKKTTPFVRYYLLWRAIDHAGQLGLTRLQCSRPGDMNWEEGIAFFKSALEDTKTFIAEAPPDSHHMRTILYWHIVISCALRGPEISPDLKELKSALQKLKITYEFGKHFEIPDRRTQLRIIQELIVERSERAWNEWCDFITRLDSLNSTEAAEQQSAANAEDNLAAWLEGTNLDDHEHHGCNGHPKVQPSNADLWHCSYCHNPSAILRKCAGCGKARYCDGSCQKLHWSEHKVACKLAQSQA